MNELLKENAIKVATAFAIAFNKYHQGTFVFPLEVRFTCKNKLMGLAVSNYANLNNVICINHQHIELNMSELVKDPQAYYNKVIPHEVAHLYTHQLALKLKMNLAKINPHGKLWQESMRKIKQDPKTFYNPKIDGFK